MNGKMKVNRTVKLISKKYYSCISLKMSDLKVAKLKQGINIIIEIYRYKINTKIQTTYYLKCVRNCRATMLLNPEKIRVLRPPDSIAILRNLSKSSTKKSTKNDEISQ